MDFLQRSAEIDLYNWFHKKNRKPLILRGARQVGKSTLVRIFAKKNNVVLNEINLERHLYLDDIFKTLNLNTIIKELEAIAGKKIYQPGSLLFLDEIQATPHALQALRYFYEEKNELALIAAGSLLEFTLADHNFSMPVGRVEYAFLGPLTFKEYISVIEPDMAHYLSNLSINEQIPEFVHNTLSERQREYIFIGGMPEAIATFKESSSLEEVKSIHRSIINTYLDDFSKYAKQRELVLLQKVFTAIPRIVGQKTKYSNISRDDRSKDVKACIELLAKALICHKVVHSHCSGLPLNSNADENMYKLIFLDIGLANHIQGLDWLSINAADERILFHEGRIAEQFIGQHLLHYADSPGNRHLHYWLREGKSINAEVDYVIAKNMAIIPIEVKAGKSGSLKSLQQFMLHKKTNFAIRFDLNRASLQRVTAIVPFGDTKKSVAFHLLSLPSYAIDEVIRIVDNCRELYE